MILREKVSGPVPIAEALRKIAPRRSGFTDPQDSIDEQPIVIGGDARIALFARQQILDSLPTFIRNCVAAEHVEPSLTGENRARSLPPPASFCPHGLG